MEGMGSRGGDGRRRGEKIGGECLGGDGGDVLEEEMGGGGGGEKIEGECLGGGDGYLRRN